MPIPEFTATITNITTAALETKVFTCELEKKNALQDFHPKAGQFISLKVADTVFRAYSLASSPKKLPRFEICVKIVPDGKASTYLDTITAGETLTFRGPFGRFFVHNPEKDMLCIATGTGIAPIKGFFEEFMRKNITGAYHLAFGVRQEEYAVYAEEFQNAAMSKENCEFTLCLSQPRKPGTHYHGRVTDWTRKKSAEYFSEKDIYICGSPAMVKEVTQILQEEKKVLKESIFTEAY